ncbi:Methyltransferase domain-containing protein [Nocardia amikacinitolerans]|uniref:Eco57I restriction-modification methylase domain-containing protein n=1 Tax=Nocardia amikacinitolerans TaxID=756689 RepID=UPI0020A2E27F|nr:DNA methyltransferase [Nocardia amikacinitolerans]MCP2298536.1 Methyltransferase domain-containing protein [Nocardia amikacinitolerans]
MTTAPKKARRRSTTTAADLHREWLELVDTDGPFLSVPALKRVWENGMPAMNADALAVLREAKPAFEKAWEEWDSDRDNEAVMERYRTARDTWVDLVLREVFGWAQMYSAGSAIAVKSPNHQVTVTATGALVRGELTGALVLVTDPVSSLRDPLDDGWAASPIDRMEELLRASDVRIGVVTDGRWWAIVSARPKTMVASGIVNAQTWIEEPQTRNAFVELLQRRCLVGGKAEDRLTELFGESVAAAEEITEALGVQVRQAVELLVQAMSESALHDMFHNNMPDPLPEQKSLVYEAAVTVMMRVVFLLFAEERGLLPQGELFTLGYGLSDQLDELDRRKELEGSEALDGTFHTWHRLLATSNALYRGASFEDIRIPSYGGSLFDPDRFGFLTALNESGALAISISDRVMLEVLRSVQVATPKGQDARRISFRDIDVEQIGYIYEGLLGYSTKSVDEITVGLIGAKGAEPEIPLTTLEELAAKYTDPTKLADALIAWAKKDQPAAKSESKPALTKAIRGSAEVIDAEQALRSVARYQELRDRLRPFIGIIRRDLRKRPYVVLPGGVVVVETASRASAGAHYTPRDLAEEVVKYALEPLVYSPGPHQTANRSEWKLISSDAILDLKVADIACGSGAFLVAAARFLAGRLVEAWQRDGAATGIPHRIQLHAIREVVAHCLYGADINPMAVEMCKLSLWLVSLDPKLPFSFVDDKVLHGNALLGLIDAKQLKVKHIYPQEPAGQLQISLFEVDVDETLAAAANLRRSLASEVDDRDPQRATTTKRRQWNDYQNLTKKLQTIADAIIAAGLTHGGKPGSPLTAAYQNLNLAISEAYPSNGSTGDSRPINRILSQGLTPTVATDYRRWKPLHWILAVPDVMEHGRFDSIIGNPPFRGGQKLSRDMGGNVRDWLVNVVADGERASSDLSAYFFLRAAQLLSPTGTIGLLGTNTISQGGTRKVGLERLDRSGLTITRSFRSRKWPVSTANLEFSTVWGTLDRVEPSVPRFADNVETTRITPLLEQVGKYDGDPVGLMENLSIAFKGYTPLGMGFTVAAEKAREWVATDQRNSEVLRAYLNGNELNSSPDLLPARWIIDFYGLSKQEASEYIEPFRHVEEHVRPARESGATGTAKEFWWIFERPRPALRQALAGLKTVIALTQTSSTQIPLTVPANISFDQKLVVFTSESPALLAILCSSPHRLWGTRWGSTRTGDLVYTPSKVFATFPRPEETAELNHLGKLIEAVHQKLMIERNLGITQLYNLVNNPDVDHSADADIANLRQLHVKIDQAVMLAYGWNDVALDHGFHVYRQRRKWTVGPAAQAEILDRLLLENHRRAANQGTVAAVVEDGIASDG